MGTKQSGTVMEGETIVEQDALTTKHPDVEFHPMLKQTIEMWCKSGIRDTYDNKCFKRDVLSRISEITSIMSQITEESNGGNSDKCRINDGVYRLDWESVYEVGASIMDQYSATVDELLADLDKLYRVCVFNFLYTTTERLVMLFILLTQVIILITIISCNLNQFRNNICGKTPQCFSTPLKVLP